MEEIEALKEFQSLILQQESETLEFKTKQQELDSNDDSISLNNEKGKSFQEFGEYFSALSNGACLKHKQYAWLILGVSDKIPRKIIGTNYFIHDDFN